MLKHYALVVLKITCGLLLIALGLFLVHYGSSEFGAAWRLKSRGKITTAELLDRKRVDYGNNYTYKVVVRFQTESKQTLTNEFEVRHDDVKFSLSLPATKSVPLRYLPSDPGNFIVGSHDCRLESLGPAVVGLILIASPFMAMISTRPKETIASGDNDNP